MGDMTAYHCTTTLASRFHNAYARRVRYPSHPSSFAPSQNGCGASDRGSRRRGASAWARPEMKWIRTAFACAALLILATLDASAADPRRVLLLHAFGHPYSPWSDMAGRFPEEGIMKSP